MGIPCGLGWALLILASSSKVELENVSASGF